MSSFVQRFTRNTAGRDLIVGDVHGCFHKLIRALADIRFDPKKDRLFSVGDLIDRGPDSKDVLSWLSKPWFHAVMGNHEQMAVMYHTGDCDPRLYGMNGGAWFIGMTPDERADYASAFFDLPFAIELETAAGLVGIVHAACDYSAWSDLIAALEGPDAQGAQSNALWGRDRAAGGEFGPVAGVRAVVVGHTPMERFTSMDNVLFIDTGAWLQGGTARRDFTILDADTLEPAVDLTKPALVFAED